MFTVSHYTPGCLPDDASHVSEHETAWEALQARNDEIQLHFDTIEDDGEFLTYDTELHSIDALAHLERGENVYFDIQGTRYAIERS